MVRDDHDQAVPHLSQPGPEPLRLGEVQPALGRASGTGGGEDDEPRSRRVVHVVGGPLAGVFVGEAVAGRMGPEEVTRQERLAAGVGGDLDRTAGQERLRPRDEILGHRVAVEARGHRHRLAVADQRSGYCRRDDPDALDQQLMIAQAADPGHSQPLGLEGLERTLEQTGQVRKAITRLHRVGAGS